MLARGLSAYAVGTHTRTPLAEPSHGVDVSKVHDGIRHSYQYTLAADYEATAANTTVPWWSLVADIATLAVANATGLPRHHINVTDIRKGSVVTMVVSFDVWVPSAFNTTQASKVDASVLAPSTGGALATCLKTAGAPVTSIIVVAREVVSQNISWNITTTVYPPGNPAMPKVATYIQTRQNSVGVGVGGVVSVVVSLIIFVVALTAEWIRLIRRLIVAEVDTGWRLPTPEAWIST
jgi:hypothetical protein